MSQRNATASWSGYSHQGQVGLLIALRELRNDIDLNKYFVAFESREDVTIYSLRDDGEKEYKSVHQVKAYYSSGNHLKKTYSSVLNDHFDRGNENYLHTVVDITDWDSPNTTNNNEILRYKYSEAQFHCSTIEIESYIKNELKIILNENCYVIENAYNRLSFELDHRIRKEHQKGRKQLFDIKFSLKEIRDIIQDKSSFTENNILECRKSFYSLFLDAKKESNFNEAELLNIEQLVSEIYSSLSNEEFLQFLQRLSLNRAPTDSANTHVLYNEDGLEQVFFDILFTVPSICPDLNKKKLIVHYSSLRYVLTTIISENKKAKQVVETILQNLENNKLLWEETFLINKEIDGSLQDY